MVRGTRNTLLTNLFFRGEGDQARLLGSVTAAQVPRIENA